MNNFLDVIKHKYATFTGRASRKEFWMFVLVNILLSIGLSIVDSTLGSGKLLGTLFSLALFIPSLALTIRRLHDTDHIGWWYLLMLLPIVGWIIVLIWLAREGTPGINRFGPNPKEGGMPPTAPVTPAPVASVPPTPPSAPTV